LRAGCEGGIVVLLSREKLRPDRVLVCFSFSITDFKPQPRRTTESALDKLQLFVVKPCFQSVLVLIVIGCIVVIVYSPFVDLPSTVHTKTYPGAVQSVRGLPSSLATFAQALPLSVDSEAFGTIPILGFDVVAITCAYLC
jgi:hypothetical protein